MTAAPSHMWYVRAAGGVWGPYPEARVADFVAEGRVRPDTPVSPWSEGPFAPANASPEFTPLFKARSAPRSPPPPAVAEEPSPQRSEPAAPALAAPVFKRPARPLLIWATVQELHRTGLYAALAELGSGVTIAPGLWLVQARAGPAAVRNHLSRCLGPTDRLLVAEASLEQTAWFNLDRDHDLRRLWAAGASTRKRLGAA